MPFTELQEFGVEEKEMQFVGVAGYESRKVAMLRILV